MKKFQGLLSRGLDGMALMRLMPGSLMSLLHAGDRHGQAEEVC